MKEYKKPAMVALSLSANDALCSCRVDTTKAAAFQDIVRLWGNKVDTNGDGVFDRKDNSFGSDCEELVPGFEIYCKFTSTDEYKIFAS